MKITMKEAFERLNKLFDTEEKWAKGYYAYNSQHYKVEPLSASACSWCFVGGLVRITSCRARVGAADSLELFAESVLEQRAASGHVTSHRSTYSVPAFNDECEFDELKDLIKACIDHPESVRREIEIPDPVAQVV